MVMRFTPAMSTPRASATSRTAPPSGVRPLGSTGSVNHTARSRPAAEMASCRSTLAPLLRPTLTASATQAPSMSKSMATRSRVSITRVHSSTRAGGSTQVAASGLFAAPPEDAMTSPPVAARIASSSS